MSNVDCILGSVRLFCYPTLFIKNDKGVFDTIRSFGDTQLRKSYLIREIHTLGK